MRDGRTVELALAAAPYPAVYVLARLTKFRLWPSRLQAGVGTGAAILALGSLALFTPPEPVMSAGSIKYWMVILVVGGFCFLRGGFTALHKITLPVFARSFQFGMVVTLVATAFSVLAHMSQSTAVTLAVSFLACGFSGLWLVRMGDVKGSGRSFQGTWIVMVIAAMAAFIAVGAAIIALVDHSLLETLLAGLYWLGQQIGRALYWFFSLFESSDQAKLPLEPPPMPAVGDPTGGHAMSKLFRVWTRRIAQVMFTVSWGSFFAMILYHNILHLMRWLRKRTNPGNAASYETTDVGFMDDVMALFRAIRRLTLMFRRGARHFFHRLLRRGREEAAIVGIYRKMLEWGEIRGLPRERDQTPYEYLRRLAASYPELETPFSAVTDSFVAARYGRRVTGEAEIDAADKNWRMIKSQKIRSGPGKVPQPIHAER